MSQTVLTVYLRRYCHLCDDLLAALAPYKSQLDFTVQEVDIDLDPALEARFGTLIPVLTGPDGVEICHYFLDAAALADCLGKIR
ncbi:MAG: glutaredoxin family protein [Sulfuriferula sp.]